MGDLVYQSTITRMDGLVLGSLAAIAFRNRHLFGIDFCQNCLKIAYVSLACVLATFMWAGSMDYTSKFARFGALPMAALFSAFILWAATHPNARLLTVMWLRSVGRKAYAMYLIHAPLAFVLNRRVMRATEQWIVQERVIAGLIYIILMTAVSYLLALVSGALIENPINRLKRHFTY